MALDVLPQGKREKSHSLQLSERARKGSKFPANVVKYQQCMLPYSVLRTSVHSNLRSNAQIECEVERSSNPDLEKRRASNMLQRRSKSGFMTHPCCCNRIHPSFSQTGGAPTDRR
jgi:hypothetical protein